jgi:hypothetical protein
MYSMLQFRSSYMSELPASILEILTLMISDTHNAFSSENRQNYYFLFLICSDLSWTQVKYQLNVVGHSVYLVFHRFVCVCVCVCVCACVRARARIHTWRLDNHTTFCIDLTDMQGCILLDIISLSLICCTVNSSALWIVIVADTATSTMSISESCALKCNL